MLRFAGSRMTGNVDDLLPLVSAMAAQSRGVLPGCDPRRNGGIRQVKPVPWSALCRIGRAWYHRCTYNLRALPGALTSGHGRRSKTVPGDSYVGGSAGEGMSVLFHVTSVHASWSNLLLTVFRTCCRERPLQCGGRTAGAEFQTGDDAQPSRRALALDGAGQDGRLLEQSRFAAFACPPGHPTFVGVAPGSSSARFYAPTESAIAV